eukprot:172661-Lingulodinium_polyedra.AAC.1
MDNCEDSANDFSWVVADDHQLGLARWSSGCQFTRARARAHFFTTSGNSHRPTIFRFSHHDFIE